MKIQGEHTFDAARPTVWRALMNPEIIARIMPGCEKLEEVGENAYEGAMKIKVGPVQGLFKGLVELSELREPEGYRLKMKGKGAPGFVEADGQLRLSETDGGTLLSYEIDAKIGGRIASVGQRLLESSTKVIARQSLEGLEAQVEAMDDEEAPAPAAPSQAKLATGLAFGVLEEMIPEKARPVVGIGIGFILGLVLLALLLFASRACTV